MRLFDEHILPEDTLSNIEGGNLFFPNSFRDYHEAILLFSPYITDFWFVDFQLFSKNQSVYEAEPLFTRRTSRYEFQAQEVIGSPSPKYRWFPDLEIPTRNHRSVGPCTLNEIFLDRVSGKRITIHRMRAHPWEAFQALDQISVFFYRYNPTRNNNNIKTNVEWFSAKKLPNQQISGYFPKVLDKLTDKGLIVTDGLHYQYEENNPYSELLKFYKNRQISRERAMSQAHLFTDDTGRTFHCVGYTLLATMGPTLIWQVKKSTC